MELQREPMHQQEMEHQQRQRLVEERGNADLQKEDVFQVDAISTWRSHDEQKQGHAELVLLERC